MFQPSGLCYSFENRTISLPLLHVHAVANIKDLAAEVKLTQTYCNDMEVPLEVTYSFAIPARASVCGFFLIKQDGARVVGNVQDKGEAREIYETAVLQGRSTALMQQQTPDVFQLAVGNISPHEQIQIELIYATELAEDEDNDSIRFHLPVHVGARYGHSPSSGPLWSFPAHFPTQPPFLQISVTVEAVAPIAKIGCPSHTVSTELGPDPALPNAQELPFSNYARVSLTSEAPLDRDFVLTVKSAGLDAPRCVAELHPIHPTTALALTLVPRFKLPDVSRQEFVFLVDRSGSMRGARIAAARRALVVMLRSLPAKDSLFQIASFGTACTSLWDDGSRAYNQATLDDATRHVDGMEANYGGTEIRKALQRCFETRRTDRPTSVFVLTDGDAWDIGGVFSEVKGAVATASAQAYLRVFVLGVGNSASTAMCEGIARVGNGTCMMVGEQESFTGKIARMLKAACTPVITDIVMDWGVPTTAIDAYTFVDEDDAFLMVSDEEEIGNAKGKKKEISLFDETVDPLQMDNQPAPSRPEVVLSPPAPVQQSPFKIRTLNPGTRLNVYAIVQGKIVPKAVTLTGLTEDGSEIKLSIPVTLSHLPNSSPDAPPAIHALAARKIIQDIEDGQHAIGAHIPDDVDLLARTVKASIVRLAKMHSITSSQTSFVAVDESDMDIGSDPLTTQSLNPDGTPKRPMNAFAIFARRRRPQVSAENQSMRTGDISKILSREWKDMLPADKQFYLTGAKQVKDTFNSNYPDYVYRRRPNNTRKRRQSGAADYEQYSIIYGAPPLEQQHPSSSSYNSIPVPNYISAQAAYSSGSAIQHTDDAASKDMQYLRRRCFTCEDTEPPSWRRSTLHPGKIVCNKCGLYERTHLRSRPLRFDELRGGAKSRKNSKGIQTATAAPVTVADTDPLEALARLQSFDGCFSPAVLSIIQLNVDLDQARAVLLEVPEVFATVIGMAFLRTKLGPTIERESWEAMYNKARAYVEAILLDVGSSGKADELEAKAVSLLI